MRSPSGRPPGGAPGAGSSRRAHRTSGASGAMVTSSKVASSRTGQRLQRPAVDDRALQPGVGENAQPIAVAHQHAAGAVRLHRARRPRRCWPRHRRHAPAAGKPRRPETSSATCISRWLWRCASAPSLCGQVGEQQRAEGRVARDQRADRCLRQLVGHHLLGCHEAAARPARHQRAAVEAIARARRLRTSSCASNCETWPLMTTTGAPARCRGPGSSRPGESRQCRRCRGRSAARLASRQSNGEAGSRMRLALIYIMQPG